MSESMTLDEAIRTALEYETRVRDLYQDAANQATEETGKKIFGRLAQEEQGHLDYLNDRYAEWERDGKIEEQELETILPPREQIREAFARLERKAGDYDWTIELGMLKKALQLEAETGGFYKRMVAELDVEGQRLFSRFIDIEETHYDVVQLQMDALTGAGFWFDAMEFDLEGA
ncbi:MAG: ferritin family protein [Planctomycetota bacterium]|jgi:rubrerythrin